MIKSKFFSVFLILLFASFSLHAMKAVKFDRYFVEKGKKGHEVVTITSSIMRVEGSDYTYVLDMSSAMLIYAKNSSSLGVKTTFRKLIRQYKQNYLPLKNTLGKLKVNKAPKPESYKRLMTLKNTVVLGNGGFITLRFIKKDPHNIFIRRFLDSLYLKLGIVPFKLNASGLVLDDKFNEMSVLISTALGYDNEGIQSFPIYIYNSTSIAQIDISNIQSITSTREMMFKNVASMGKKQWYDEYVELAITYYNKALETVVHVLFGKTVTNKTESVESLKIPDDDLVRKKVASSKFDYSFFWKMKRCKFKKYRTRLLFMYSQSRGMIFETKSIAPFRKFYKQMLDNLDSLKNLSTEKVDNAMRKDFKAFVKSEGYKRAKVRKTSLVKHANLCYLHSRLHKKYTHMTNK